MKQCVVEVGGFHICLVISEVYFSEIIKRLEKFLSDFLGECDATVYIYDEGNTLIDRRFEMYIETNVQEDKNIIYSYARSGLFGTFDHKTNTGHYYISKTNGPIERNPLLPLFCVLSVVLPKHGALLFHCSAVVDDENLTYLFTGKSGSGKTTICQMLNETFGFDIISDDTVVLKIEDGKSIGVYTTPFWDVLRSTKPYGVVKSINAIYQSKHTKVIPENSKALMGCLMKNAFYRAPKKVYSVYLQNLFTTTAQLSKLCEFNVIEFEKNLDFWRVLNSEKSIL